MFCEKCGKEIETGIAFCPNCGNEVPAASTAEQSVPPVQTRHKRYKLTAAITGVIILFAVAVAVSLLIFNNKSTDKSVDRFVDALFSGDADAVLDWKPEDMPYKLALVGLMPSYDSSHFQDWNDFSEDWDIELAHSGLKSGLREMMEDLDDKYGSDWSYSYQLVGEAKMNIKYLEDINNQLNIYGYAAIEEAKTVEIEVTISYHDFRTDRTTWELILCRSGNKWFPLIINPQDLVTEFTAGHWIELPKLVEEQLAYIQEQYRNLRFEVVATEYNNDHDAGVILEQSPEAGATVKDGSVVKVKVSKGDQ